MKIKINVVGQTASGKSTIQMIIADALRREGFNVKLNSVDFINVKQLREYAEPHYTLRKMAVAKKIEEVEINEVQLQKAPLNG